MKTQPSWPPSTRARHDEFCCCFNTLRSPLVLVALSSRGSLARGCGVAACSLPWPPHSNPRGGAGVGWAPLPDSLPPQSHSLAKRERGGEKMAVPEPAHLGDALEGALEAGQIRAQSGDTRAQGSKDHCFLPFFFLPLYLL